MRLRDISIQYKLLLIILITSGVALLAACTAFVALDFLSTREALTRRLISLADVVGANSTAALSFDNPRDASETLTALRAESHIVSAAIYDESGRSFAAFHRDMDIFDPPVPGSIGYTFRDDSIDVLRPIVLDGERIGTIFVRSDLLEVDERIHHYAQIVVIFIFISTAIALLIGYRLRSVIFEPILRLLRAMQGVSDDGRYSIRVAKHANDELGELIDGFNHMLGQIQQRDEVLREVQAELALRARELQVELTERGRAEERTHASLREQEVLLKEIHHRVKNNLQIIASLLDLQARQVEEDEALTEMLSDSRNRVRSMALVHDHLYQTDDLAKINLGQYLDELCHDLTSSYGRLARHVDLHTEVDDIAFNIDTAIPCGLIINELVSNALKYAFPGDRGGTLTVTLRCMEDQRYELCVKDDGIGLPASINIETSPSLGLQLVTALTRQIRGEIDVDRGGGTHFRLRFRGVDDNEIDDDE